MIVCKCCGNTLSPEQEAKQLRVEKEREEAAYKQLEAQKAIQAWIARYPKGSIVPPGKKSWFDVQPVIAFMGILFFGVGILEVLIFLPRNLDLEKIWGTLMPGGLLIIGCILFSNYYNRSSQAKFERAKEQLQGDYPNFYSALFEREEDNSPA